MTSESYYGAYLFIDCDNPSIFSTITKNHIVIFVCYKPYLGFLDMISWFRAILTAPSTVPSRKPSLGHYFCQLDMNCLIGIRHFQFQVDQRSMWGGNLSWFEIFFFEIFRKFSRENEIRTSPCQVGLGRAYALWFRVLQVIVCRGRSSHLYWQGDSVHGVWHFEPGSSKSQISSDRIPTAKSWNKK